MSAILQVSAPPTVNRRRRVRQRVHAPAYASFVGESQAEMKSAMLDLYEILDISEVGLAIQGTSPMEIGLSLEVCLDLAEAGDSISAVARVVWSDVTGRSGLALPVLPDSTLHRLREWLFLNSMAGAANAASSGTLTFPAPDQCAPRPSYTDTLTTADAIQREAQSLGNDLEAVLALIAARSRSLLRASGAAIALSGEVAEVMICRASAGQSAPPVGVSLQVGSGFSGECVRTGEALRCNDTETDERVDRQSCRALGIRSMLAVPLRHKEKEKKKVIGLLEVFSSRPQAFSQKDASVLQRFAETLVAAINRSAPAPAPVSTTSPTTFYPAPGSLLFAAASQEKPQETPLSDEIKSKVGGIQLPRFHLYLLIIAAATIALALGFIFAPRIQKKLQTRGQIQQSENLSLPQTSTDPARLEPVSLVNSSNLLQLRELAQHGDPAAENAIGLLYAQGDEKQSIQPDEGEAARWFAKAAEDGSVLAQYKLALLYWGGHGVPKDPNKAYFWAVLARAGGEEGSKDLAKVLANGMTRPQSAAIEQQAEIWYQQHETHGKPQPGR